MLTTFNPVNNISAYMKRKPRKNKIPNKNRLQKPSSSLQKMYLVLCKCWFCLWNMFAKGSSCKKAMCACQCFFFWYLCPTSNTRLIIVFEQVLYCFKSIQWWSYDIVIFCKAKHCLLSTRDAHWCLGYCYAFTTP